MSETVSSLAIGLIFLVAGGVKGVVGMGLPTVAMPLLSLVMPAAAAAAVLVVPSTVTNVWQMAVGPNCVPLLRRFATMMAGVTIGTIISIENLTRGSTGQASAGLGMVLAIYGLFGLSGARFVVSARSEPWLSPIVGGVTGLISGSTGVFMVPAVPYLNSLGLQREQLIQALGLSFTVSTLALAAALAIEGEYPVLTLKTSAFAVIPAVAGMIFGQLVRDRLAPETFKRWFFIGVTTLGLYMVIRIFW